MNCNICHGYDVKCFCKDYPTASEMLEWIIKNINVAKTIISDYHCSNFGVAGADAKVSIRAAMQKEIK